MRRSVSNAIVVVKMHSGLIIVHHLSIQLPFAGIIWQLLHHLIGFRSLDHDVFYIEDGGGQWVYDAAAATFIPDPLDAQ
jgi:hypothetical protein